jgi:hypothetical protein
MNHKETNASAGYEKSMNEVWAIKDGIARETKGLDLKECMRYIRRNTSGLRKRFSGRYKKAAAHVSA